MTEFDEPSSPYMPPTPPAARRLSLQDCGKIQRDQHEAMRCLLGCDAEPEHRWSACEMFVLARIRGICHTWYVVQTPELRKFTVIDWMSEGPVDGLRAEMYEGFPSYAAALRFAAEQTAQEDDDEHGDDEPPIRYRCDQHQLRDLAEPCPLMHGEFITDAYAAGLANRGDDRADGYDRNGASDGFQVVSDADPGL